MWVRSDRLYRFTQDPEQVWAAIADVERFPHWWPWLRAFDGAALAPGETWRCQVQPPLPYALRFVVAIDRVDEGEHVEASITGDLTGTASLHVRPLDPGDRAGQDDDGAATEVRLTSALAPVNHMLRAVARVAAPVARHGHDWILDTGARQFRRRGLAEVARPDQGE